MPNVAVVKGSRGLEPVYKALDLIDCGSVLKGRETGNVMGVLSLGAGVCGYVGPQMLGVLREWTTGFSAGWYMMAAIALLTLIELLLLKRHEEKRAMREAAAWSTEVRMCE